MTACRAHMHFFFLNERESALPSSADFMLSGELCRQVQRTFPRRTTVSDQRFISQYSDDFGYL